MTISYTKEVASSHIFGIFWRLLFRWKGSVYKTIWPELIVFTVLYVILSLVYRCGLEQSEKRKFEKVALYCRAYVNAIPVTFVLGFYVTLVVNRWWGQFKALPWPDNLATLVSNSIRGKDTRAMMIRRAIVRYTNLAFVLTLQRISPRIQTRFPDLESLVKEGYLLDTEKQLLEDTYDDADGMIFWVPLVWAVSLVDTSRKEKCISSDLVAQTTINEINAFRGKCGALLAYNWISIPLVYTQVVTLAVYSYLLASILGRQFLENDGISQNPVDIYVPLFGYLEVIFYLGWLKVAESLFNPFGYDDEDFDVNAVINRNLKTSYLIANKMMDAHPELHYDKHWKEIINKHSLMPTSSKEEKEEKEASESEPCLTEAKENSQNMTTSIV